MNGEMAPLFDSPLRVYLLQGSGATRQDQGKLYLLHVNIILIFLMERSLIPAGERMEPRRGICYHREESVRTNLLGCDLL